ncbi:hypothetical protein BVRB_021850 [Beta vulgaris subsp. vulgaris]|uniref:Uncharacterized protein n=1 Tax=Beta vulgaris subsp. vulgaris TaxID=3555 RepID=A0A0J8B061_BETVV|nr:hypothetical protein BVRB_021850 [Beta vulgaris subsp. vulgaris]
MVVVPSQISHVIACMPLNNEELCIVGPESMLIYSRKLGVWRKCGRMPQLHINGAAGRIHQTIAVCGGCCVYDDEEGEPSPPTANVDKYDLVRNEWKQADDAPIQCESMAFTVWENSLVIAGGYTDVDLDSLSDQVYVYNQDSWKCIRSISPSQTLALFTLERCLFAYRGDDRFSRYVEDTDRWENADHQFSSGSDKTRDLGKILIIAIEAALIGDIQSGNNRDPQRWNRRLRKR